MLKFYILAEHKNQYFMCLNFALTEAIYPLLNFNTLLTFEMMLLMQE